MSIYLDNSATTRVLPEVQDLMHRVMDEEYGNPSSLHAAGAGAERRLKEAAEQIAQTMRVPAASIIFTSGGTESNNLAVLGAARAHGREGHHLITTQIEHDSVYAAAKQLEKEGWDVTFLPVDRNGVADPGQLKEAIRPDTVLVSVMHVNNEVGAVQPVEEMARIVHEAGPQILFHVDAIQGYGKYTYRPQQSGIDLLSASGHKIHGPKGVGFLYVSPRARIVPILYGGGQQKGLRSGTENMPGIAGIGLAAQRAYEKLPEEASRLRAIKDRLVSGLAATEGCRVHGLTDERSAPHIVSCGFAGVRSEVLLHALEDREIYVSAGSACSSHHRAASRTLTAMQVPEEYLGSTLRFSLGAFSKEEDAEKTVAAVRELLPMLRMFTHR